MRFLHADRDGSNEITLFLDRDTNPYNGNNVRTLRRFKMSGSDNPTAAKVSVPTDGIEPGSYYIGLQMSDPKGILRIGYTMPVEIVAASSASIQASARFSEFPIAPVAAAATARKHRDERMIDLVGLL